MTLPTPSASSSLSPAVVAVVDDLRHAGLSDAWVNDLITFTTLAEQWPPSGITPAQMDAGMAYLRDLAETLSYRHDLILDAVERLGNTGLQELALAKGVADLPAYRTLVDAAAADGGLAPYFVKRTGPVQGVTDHSETIFHQNVIGMVDSTLDDATDACVQCLASLPVDLLTPGIGSLTALIHIGCAAAVCPLAS